MSDYFFIRTENKFVRIRFADILYVEALKNYIRMVTEHTSHLILITMKQMERELPEHSFCRVHRSFIVSLEKIVFFDNETIKIAAKEIPISSHFKSLLLQRVNIVQQENAEPVESKTEIILS